MNKSKSYDDTNEVYQCYRNIMHDLIVGNNLHDDYEIKSTYCKYFQ